MPKKYSYKIFLRSDYPKKDGSIPIYLRVIINRQKRDYSLNVSIFEPIKYWDQTHRQIKRCSWVKMDEINTTIRDAETRAHSIFKEIKEKNINLTLKEFDKLYKNPVASKECFYTYADNQRKKMDNPAPDTKRSYESYISKMKKFRAELSFGEITKEFVEQYRDYMISIGNEINTYNKALSWLKTQTKRALKEKLILNDPFDGIKLKFIPGKRDFLTLDELNQLDKLYNKNILKKGVQNALRVFLFFCYSGLRYRDAKALKMSDLITEKYGEKEVTIIRIKQNKTDEWVSIPLPEKATALLEEKFKNQTVMRVPSGQVINRHLKTIAKKAELNKNITFQVARHTFGVCTTEMDFPIQVISKLMGHTNLKTTQIYTKILENKRIEYQSLWDTYGKTPTTEKPE